MLFATRAPFGVLGWLGWIFFPHLTAAILATKYYWQTNPILCTMAWFIAFVGTTGELKLGKQATEPTQNQPRHSEQIINPIKV